MVPALNLRPGGPRPRYRGATGVWLALVAVPAGAQVAQLSGQTLFQYQAANNYGGNYLAADGGVIYTDNVQRTSNGIGEALLMAGLSGNTSREGSRLDYHLATNLALLKYTSSTYPTRLTGYLDGRAVFKIMPGFFSWIVRESYSQLQINAFAPVTPENLVSLNYITTGPRFTVRPTLRTSVTLDALYSYLSTSSASTQYASFDNHRYGGNLNIERAFSETSSLYLKGYYEKVEFKDQGTYNNFSIGTATAGYRLTNGRTVLDVSGGYSQLRIYDVLGSVESVGGSRETLTTEKFDEPTWAVEISRLITPSQRVALTASQQFTDSAAAFRLGFDQPVPTIAPQLANGYAFKQRDFGLIWRFQAARTSVDVGLVALSQRYLAPVTATSNDRDLKIANALLTRQLSPVLWWDIGVTYQRTRQIGASSAGVPAQSSDETGALTDLNWQVGERLNLRFIYAHSHQSGTYTENQVGVIASWALLGAQQRMMPAAPGLSPISPVSARSPYH